MKVKWNKINEIIERLFAIAFIITSIIYMLKGEIHIGITLLNTGMLYDISGRLIKRKNIEIILKKELEV